MGLLLVGINPGLRSAERNRHFAGPGNRFWPALAAAGVTPRLYGPGEQHLLPELGIGITNLVTRESARADELSRDELRAGAAELTVRVERLRPVVVAVLGVTAYRVAFGRPRATVGPQADALGRDRIPGRLNGGQFVVAAAPRPCLAPGQHQRSERVVASRRSRGRAAIRRHRRGNSLPCQLPCQSAGTRDTNSPGGKMSKGGGPGDQSEEGSGMTGHEQARPLRALPTPVDPYRLLTASAERLMARVARGDQQSFAALYDRVGGQVFGLVRRILRDPAQSEEVTQEILLEVWRTATRFDAARGSATAWIMTMAHRRAVDRVRSEQSSRDRDERVGVRDRQPDGYDEVSEAVELRFEHQQVREALDQLTDLQREAVELAYYSGYTYREVADLLEAPLGTVKTRLRDGLIRLRDTLVVAP